MKCNVGGFERWARIFIGIGIISFAFIGPKSYWAWLGLIPLVTGLIRYCPLSDILGFDSCRNVTTKEEKQ